MFEIKVMAYDAIVDGICYALFDSTAHVTYYHYPSNNAYSGSVVIPKTITYKEKSYIVNAIGGFAFSHCPGLTDVTIPSSVTSIGQDAFSYCPNLVSVSIPNSVKRINNNTFEGCSSLTSVSIPSSVKSIGIEAFYGCSSLLNVTIPDSVTTIGSEAFMDCSSLSCVSIPNSVTSIGYDAFKSTAIYDNSSNGVYLVDKWVCGYKGTMPSNTVITLQDGIIGIADNAFVNYLGLSGMSIPNSVLNVGSGAFIGCSSLTTVTLGECIVSIGDGAFMNCSNLTDVYCYAREVPLAKSTTFSYSNIIYATLHVPKESIIAYRVSAPWKDFKDIVRIVFPTHILMYVVDGETYKTLEIEEGETITPEASPTKEGYTFSGWSEIPETMPAHDVTVTGTFSINSYTLTYLIDDEVYKTMEVVYGSTITPEAAPTKEGYAFSGWSEILETMPAHDVTVTGTFVPNNYPLVYLLDGDEYKTVDVPFGSVITPEPDPEKEGYTFSGWIGLPETMPAKLVIVTGSFSINSYTLTYMIGDEMYKQVVYEYGATITPEPQPEGDYVTFEWVGIPETMPAHDVTVTAVYETGIAEIMMMAQQGQVRIYSPNGKLLNRLQKGLNIVVMQDGTTRKVVVK